MIEETLNFAGATQAETAVDVGCGIGGSSRYIVSNNICSVHNIHATRVTT